jgi:hypothetical protein
MVTVLLALAPAALPVMVALTLTVGDPAVRVKVPTPLESETLDGTCAKPLDEDSVAVDGFEAAQTVSVPFAVPFAGMLLGEMESAAEPFGNSVTFAGPAATPK